MPYNQLPQVLPEPAYLSYLAGHDTEHLGLNAVELIKAAPCATLHQTAEDAGHGLVVQAFTTIHDHTLHTHGLGQVFDCFSLACQMEPQAYISSVWA